MRAFETLYQWKEWGNREKYRENKAKRDPLNAFQVLYNISMVTFFINALICYREWLPVCLIQPISMAARVCQCYWCGAPVSTANTVWCSVEWTSFFLVDFKCLFIPQPLKSTASIRCDCRILPLWMCRPSLNKTNIPIPRCKRSGNIKHR